MDSPASIAAAQQLCMHPEYADVGLPALPHPMYIQSMTLNAIMHTIEEPKDFLYLEQCAFPVCLPSLLEYAQTSMDVHMESSQAALVLVDLRPYFSMLGTCPESCMKYHCKQQ